MRVSLRISPRRGRVRAFIVVLGLVVTFGLADRMANTPGVFSARVQVRFMPPSLDASNSYQYTPSSMILVAGSVGQIVGNNDARFADADATLVGGGVTQGYSIRLPNTGGQWANQFVNPYLDLQVVDTSQDAVEHMVTTLTNRIDNALLDLQNNSDVPRKYRITTQSFPAQTTVAYEKGSSGRAALGTLLLGLSITYLLWRSLGARRVRPSGDHFESDSGENATRGAQGTARSTGQLVDA